MKTILVDAVDAFVIEDEGIYQPMFELLEQYPNRKIILTGANDEQMDAFGLRKMPYEVFTLKHSPEKTDPAYYREMLSYFNLNPIDCVYFEHNDQAIKSAQSIGIPSYHYNIVERDMVGLKEFLDRKVNS